MISQIDERRLQRLVDGEMSTAERCEFLESLDASPDAWRSVALAFIEEQILSREIAGACASLPGTAHLPIDRARQVVPSLAKGGPGGVATKSEVQKTARIQTSPRLSYAITVACAAIALCTGFLWGSAVPSGGANVPPHGITHKEAEPHRAQSVPGDGIPQHRVQFMVGEGDDAHVVEVPAYTEDELRALAAPTKGEIAVQLANQQLRRLGYRLEPQTQFLTGKLKDGRELMFPVQTMTVSYEGQ